MPEIKSLAYYGSELDGKFWCGIQKKRSAGFYNSATLLYPFTAPLHVFNLCNTIIVSILIIFTDIEWGVCKYGVNDA